MAKAATGRLTDPPTRRGERSPAPPATGPSFRRGLYIGAVTVLAVGALVWAVTRPSALEQDVARLEEESAVRDSEQVVELTDTARGTVDGVAGVLGEMAAAMPPGDDAGPGALADPDAVDGWVSTLEEAATTYDDPPSGETTTNVARGSIANAMDQLLESARTYRTALDADEALQPEVIARATEQRNLGVRVWSVGATQLDYVNVEAGNGHQHVYLPTDGVGGFTPDSSPEGGGALPDAPQ